MAVSYSSIVVCVLFEGMDIKRLWRCPLFPSSLIHFQLDPNPSFNSFALPVHSQLSSFTFLELIQNLFFFVYKNGLPKQLCLHFSHGVLRICNLDHGSPSPSSSNTSTLSNRRIQYVKTIHHSMHRFASHSRFSYSFFFLCFVFIFVQQIPGIIPT